MMNEILIFFELPLCNLRKMSRLDEFSLYSSPIIIATISETVGALY